MKAQKVIRSGKYLRLVIRDGWEYVERVNCSGVVIIVAKTADNKLLLVEQFRPPVQCNVIGFPAGLVGDTDDFRNEGFAAAASRELVEETGYLPSKVRTVFVGPVSAGMCPDKITIVHATGLKKVSSGGGLGPHEKILVHEVPLLKVNSWLRARMKKGCLIGPNVFAGLYFLEHWLKR